MDWWLFSPTLKKYFDIEQELIFEKLKYLFFPCKKLSIPEGQDLNNSDHPITYPELYLPSLSLITYVLIVCLIQVLRGEKLQPDFIIDKIYSCILVTLTNVIIFKLMFKVTADFSIPFLDCLALCGYKYFLLCLYVIIRESFGNIYGSQYFVILILSLMYGLFCWKIFDQIHVQYGSSNGKQWKRALLLTLIELFYCYLLLWLCN